MWIYLALFACVFSRIGKADSSISLTQIDIPESDDCIPYLSDTLMVFICSSGSSIEIQFYYFKKPPNLLNWHNVNVNAVYHIQITSNLAALTVVDSTG